MSTALRVSDLSKWFRLRGSAAKRATADGGFWALREVGFEVEEGEVLGIIGRNGAGKSTLLKILSRVTTPTAGRVELYGRVGSLLEVGTGFHPDLSGRENVFLNGALLGMRRREIRERMGEIAEFAGVEKFLDEPVKHYSSGMYMRLAFAVAAHLEPEILIVDEVLAVGDAEFQAKCLRQMESRSARGRTVILVSHNLNAIRRLCRRSLWLDGGKVRVLGPTSEALAAYEAAILALDELDGGRTCGFLGWSVVEGDATAGHRVETIMEPVRFRFELTVDREIASGHIGLALLGDQGEVVWGKDHPIRSVAAGRHRLSLEVPALPIRPGSYVWRASLWSDRTSLDDCTFPTPLVIAAPPVAHTRPEWAGLLNLPSAISFAPG